MVNERGEMLLLKFMFGSKTWWVTPGGGLEEGESFEEALRREVLEPFSISRLDELLGEINAGNIPERPVKVE